MKQTLEHALWRIASNPEDYQILCYGLEQCFFYAVYFLSAIVCGLLWGEVPFVLLLYCGLFLLRPYGGGYHADTKAGCFCISTAVLHFAAAGKSFLFLPSPAVFFLCACSLLILWFWGPVENPIHPLKSEERRKYAKKGRLLACTYALLAAAGVFFQGRVLGEAAASALILTAISMAAGKKKYAKGGRSD